MKSIVSKLSAVGIGDKQNPYIACKIKVFNYFNIVAFTTILLRLAYLSFFSENKYTGFTLILNAFPLLLCAAFFLLQHYRKHITRSYISYLVSPVLIFFVYMATHDKSIAIFQIVFLIFPFYFLEKKWVIALSFSYTSFWFALTLSGDITGWLFYNRNFYSFDLFLSVFNIAFGLLLIFGVIYSIKSVLWSFQESLYKKKIQLQKEGEMKDKLISIISHDMRTPFATTSQLLDMLKNTPMEKEEFTYYVSELKEMVDNTRNTMENLLAWTKSQMKNDKAIKADVELKELSNEVINSISKQARNKNILLKNEVCCDAIAYADKDMMHIIMRNLISNAVKFTPHGGVITVSAGMHNDRVIIEVKDNGMGIPEGKQALILSEDIYTSPGTEQEKGTGIGLKLCSDLAFKNNGTLYFDSKPGQGTSFFLEIPKFKIKKLFTKKVELKMQVA